MYEELTPRLLSTVVANVVIVTPVATLLLSALLLWLYRRTVSRHMLATGEFDEGADETEAGGLSSNGETSDHRPSEEATLYRQVLRGPWSVALGYAFAGLAFALVFAVAWGFVHTNRHGVPGFLLGVWYYIWPLVPALLLTVPSSWRARSAYVAAYFTVFMLLVLWASTILDIPAQTLGAITVPARSSANPLNNARLWAVANGVPTILMLLCFNRWVRAVAPLVLGLVTTTLGGVLVVLHALFTERGTDATVAVAVATHMDIRWLLLLVVVLSVALFGAGGWVLVRRVTRAYRRRTISDQTLMLDALWLLFAVYYAFWLIPGGVVWAVTAVIAFGAYKLSLAVARRIIARPTWRGRGLTFLRVFSLGRRSERLLEALAGSWRHVGSVQMIIGPDVARSTVRPHQFLDFLSGKLTSHFVRDAASLEHSLAECDRFAGPDGRYRINNFFCHADSWQHVLPRLIWEDDVVLMDLRSFSEVNAGCIHELEHLVGHVPLDRCLLIVDETTDRAFLERTLDEAWEGLPPGSPNRRRTPDEAPLHPFDSGIAAVRELLRGLCHASAG